MTSYKVYNQEENENTPLYNKENYNQPNAETQSRYGFTSVYYSREINFPRQETVSVQPVQSSSPWLYRLGITQTVLSVLHFVCSLGFAFYYDKSTAVYVNMASAIFLVAVGIVSIIGSKNDVLYRKYLIACFLMSLISMCVVFNVVVIFDIAGLAGAYSDCFDCNFWGKECPRECLVNLSLVFGLLITIAVSGYTPEPMVRGNFVVSILPQKQRMQV